MRCGANRTIPSPAILTSWACHNHQPSPYDDTDWEEACALVKHSRSAPAELELAAGHVFGENDAVPMSCILTHVGGLAVPGIFAQNSSAVLHGTDPADATDHAIPLKLPRGDDSSGSEDE